MSDEDTNVTEAVDSQPNESDVKARQFGWVPKDEYRGDPEKWRDSEAFLRRGEEINGFLRANNVKISAELASTKQEVADIRQTMSELQAFHQTSLANTYKKVLDDLKQAKIVAIEQGDGAKVVQIDDEIANTREAQRQPPKPTANNAQIQKNYFEEWLPDNQWYVKDPELQLVADDFGELLKKNKPHLFGTAFLEEIATKVRRAYPEKFENPNRSQSAISSSSDGVAPARKGKKSYENLPADAKLQCDKFVKQKILTREQYCAEYDWD